MEATDGATSLLSRFPRSQTNARGFKNKTWVSGGSRSVGSTPAPPDGLWQRGGHRGGRGRGGSILTRMTQAGSVQDDHIVREGDDHHTDGEETQEGPSKTWDELVKAREAERLRAISEGKMDDPSKPKRLDEAITMVGTCQDMCPEFERYRRERENNLDRWECIMGPDGKPTRKVDHRRAVKIYERGQGDKIIPSDLRPPPVLKRTLDYLYHTLLPRAEFHETQAFIRDRSRAVRNDFTIQQETGPIAMDCHERCARYHILSLHVMSDIPSFDRAMEIQQLMNSLLSLREFYPDQRGRYQSPNELEMRIYHRLGLIRDQHDRNDQTPQHILDDPAFQLISRFRAEVQAASSPITKTSKMVVNAQAMNTFAELAEVLRARGNIVMIYLVACFLEYIFGKETIDDIESIRGDMSVQDIINGISPAPAASLFQPLPQGQSQEEEAMDDDFISVEDDMAETGADDSMDVQSPGLNGTSAAPTAFQQQPSWPSSSFSVGSTPPQPSTSVFGQLANTSKSVFGPSTTGSVFGHLNQSSPFGSPPKPSVSVFGGSGLPPSSSVFGGASTSSLKDAGSITNGGLGMKAQSSMDTKQPASIFTVPLPSVQPSAASRSLADQPPLTTAATSVVSGLTSSHPTGSRLNPTAPPFVPPIQTTSTPTTSSPPNPAFSPGSLFNSPVNGNSPEQRPQSLAGSSTTNKPMAISTTPTAPRMVQSTSASKLQPSLFIDTRPSAISKPLSRKQSAIESPLGPPPLKRAAPISLPGTPVVGLPPPPATPSSPIPLLRFPGGIAQAPQQNGLFTPPQPMSQILPSGSPIAPNRPLSFGSLSATGSVEKFAATPFPGRRSKAELEKLAGVFMQSHNPIKRYFALWHRKMQELKEWKDACSRSELYRQKNIQSSPPVSASRASSVSPALKRRVISSDLSSSLHSSAKRRVRRKYQQPAPVQTDDQRVERLKENKKEHDRRWATGSFVEAICKRIRHPRDSRISASWRVWLSMNPDSDATAIWLETKFNVPASGQWESENIFSVNPMNMSSSQAYPGLIVFECVPLGDTMDELERKYRILDDCTRLRDIADALPPDDPFLPSLVFITWTKETEGTLGQDLLNMANDLVQKGVIQDTKILAISSLEADLDMEFSATLNSLELDLAGKLIEWLSLEELYERFATPWQSAVSLWLETCGSGGEIDWLLYGRVVQTFLKALDALGVEVMSLWEPAQLPPPPLSEPNISSIRSPDSAYDALQNWLITERQDIDFVRNTLTNLRFRDDFLLNAFLDMASNAMLRKLGELTTTSGETHAISTGMSATAILRYRHSLEESSSSLQRIAKSLPRTRRRRSKPQNGDADESFSHISSTTQSSPGSSASKLEVSISSDHTDPPSPSSSAASVADSTSSVVTVSMLRELTRSVMKTYGVKTS